MLSNTADIKGPVAPRAGYGVGAIRAWVTLVLLGLLYLMSFVDRFILALLVIPLKQDLGLTNLQLGLLFGTAFAIFYGMLGLPLARLADRSNRRVLITSGAVLWSMSTIASGFATSFGFLILCRIGLAIGEAALSPAAFSLIRDLFPPHRRSIAASVYSSLGMVGGGGGYILGGFLVGLFDAQLPSGSLWGFRVWQLTLFSVGIPALMLATLFWLVTREPKRAGAEDDTPIPSLREAFGLIGGNFSLYGLLLLGGGLCLCPLYALAAWMPYYLHLRFGYAMADAGLLYGLISIAAAVLGSLGLVLVTDRLSHHGRSYAVAICSGVATLVGGVALVLAGFQHNMLPFMGFVSVGLVLLAGGANNVLAAFQHIVPPRLLGTMSALCLMSMAFLGLGIGPPVLALFDLSRPGSFMPAPGIAALALFASGAGTLCFLLNARAARRAPTRP